MTTRVNGGITNTQTLAGSLRFFKMTGPFAWTVSDGTVNLNLPTSGAGATPITYYNLGVDRPVPQSAAEFAFAELTKKADVVIIHMPAAYGATTEIHFACSASAFGWGSDTPDYTNAPGPEDMTAAAPQMQAAVRALGAKTVYVTAGAADPKLTPVTATADLSTVTIVEVPFILA